MEAFDNDFFVYVLLPALYHRADPAREQAHKVLIQRIVLVMAGFARTKRQSAADFTIDPQRRADVGLHLSQAIGRVLAILTGGHIVLSHDIAVCHCEAAILVCQAIAGGQWVALALRGKGYPHAITAAVNGADHCATEPQVAGAQGEGAL